MALFSRSGWAGFRYWLLFFSSFKTHHWRHLPEPPSGLWKEGIGSGGSQSHPVAFPSPTLKASCCFCLGLASPPPLSLSLFPSLPPLFKPWERNEEKHTNQEGFSLHCVFQLDLNRRRSIQPSPPTPPSSLLLPCPLCFVSFSVCVFGAQEKAVTSQRREETRSISCQRATVPGPHGPGHPALGT